MSNSNHYSPVIVEVRDFTYINKIVCAQSISQSKFAQLASYQVEILSCCYDYESSCWCFKAASIDANVSDFLREFADINRVYVYFSEQDFLHLDKVKPALCEFADIAGLGKFVDIDTGATSFYRRRPDGGWSYDGESDGFSTTWGFISALLPTICAVADNAKYLRSGASYCPFCESHDISSGEIDCDGLIASAKVTCDSCKSEWIDEYKLIGYSTEN